MKLSLGPIQYYWTRDAVREFYAAVADAPVDVVYLGETVCSRRREVSFEDWLMLTWSLGCTGFFEPMLPPSISMARFEITSLAFMLV